MTPAPDDPTPDGQVLTFPDGIPGFPGMRRWRLSEAVEDSAFQLLECLDAPELTMVVAIPWLFFPDYALDLDDDDAAALGLTSMEDAVVFASVTVPEADGAPTMNLLGPFVVNRHTLVGRQVIVDAAADRVRTPLPIGG
jgi:flagellar assembly factor FliW